MSNMSYCRFRNTLADLSDCYDSWDEPIEDDEEVAARHRLVKLCKKIAEDYGQE